MPKLIGTGKLYMHINVCDVCPLWSFILAAAGPGGT